MIRIIALLIGLASPVLAQNAVDPLTKEQLKSEVKYIASIFENFYAPRSWKEQHTQWNVGRAMQNALNTIEQAASAKEYRSALSEFLLSTADYHVGYSFYSTETAKLPFVIRTVEGRSIVIDIDRAKLPSDRFDLAVGDEVLSFDGVSISELRNQLAPLIGKNVPETDSALVDLTLTTRSGRKNMNVPKGTVTVEYAKKDGKKSIVQLAWEYQPELISELKQSQRNPLRPPQKKMPFPQMVNHDVIAIESPTAKYGIGLRESFLPDFGSRIWESAKESPFDAYIFQDKDSGKLLGVVRIPSYSPENSEKAVESFRDIIKKMESSTSGLIIEQMNNPGGSVFYLYTLASMLSDQGLVTPLHKMSLTSGMVSEAAALIEKIKKITNDEEAIKELGKTLDGYPVSYQTVMMINNFCHFVMNEWKEGKKLTSPHYIWGVDRINPYPSVRYTKPITIITNELDFSGGDFFPAIMQDNKRAKIVGSRTAGAGGYVEVVQIPNSFGLSRFSFTGSIAERVNKNPIENLGVTPDQFIPITIDDYRDGFKKFMEAVKSTVL